MGKQTQSFYASIDFSYKECFSFLFLLVFTKCPQTALSFPCLFSLFTLLLTVFRLFLLLAFLGVCDQNHVNDFTLHDGSVTSDSSVFIQDWTVEKPGKICEIRKEDRCSEHATSHCHLLLSSQFAECHKIIPPNMFYKACTESSCYEDEACEMITSYAHICREYGVCVDWRTPEFCRKWFTLH